MAPFLAGLLTSGLRLVANAALVKGKEYIEEKTGVDIGNANLSEADTAKLRQFQMEHEEELLRIQLEDNKLSLEETKAYLADVQDARSHQTALQSDPDAERLAKVIQPILAMMVVIGSIALFAFFVVASGDNVDANGNVVGKGILNEDQKDIIIYILGVLSAAVTQVLGYYFGSSSGSKSKTFAMTLMSQNKPKV